MGWLGQAKGRIKKITGTIVETKTVGRGWKAQEIVEKVKAGLGDLKADLKEWELIVYRTSAGECPWCYGRAYRVQRRLIDRLLSLIAPRYRYRCGSLGCGWEGNLSLSARPRRTEPGMWRNSHRG